MMRNSPTGPVFLALLLAFGVSMASRAATTPAPAAEAATAESRKLADLVDAYFEEQLKLNPLLATSIGDPRYNDRFEVTISPEWRARDEKLERDYLERIRAIDPRLLSGQDALTYEIFKSAREREIEGFRFPGHLIPVNQFYSVPNSFAQLGSGNGLHPFKTVKDYEDFLKRVERLRRLDRPGDRQHARRHREGLHAAEGAGRAHAAAARGPARREARGLAVLGSDRATCPPRLPAAERQRLTAAYRAAITNQVIPSYRRLHDFLRDEYLPKARTSVGLDALPDGKAWYEYNVRNITTTDYTPAQIHEIGLREVERIHGEMRKVMQQVGFEGSLDDFFRFLNTDEQFVHPSREALVAGYVDIKKRVDPQLPKLFEILPNADYEVRAVEPFREKSAAGGQYQAASEDGSRPGIFYANAYDLKARPKWAMEALSLHEGNPGHHFQISIQREQKNLPRFRRFGGYTAYSEGWGLYAESLGPELGVYKDPYQYFGRLEGELFRAIRLVVDTGLHSKGWTREQVLEYIDANSATSDARRIAETERYIAIPGQAVAYKIGQLKISELRARAERELGDRFDVRKFHTAVLADGALPLDVLEAKIDRWIAAQKGG